jgi:uncharacterized repeat protein (TIGR03803 family)
MSECLGRMGSRLVAIFSCAAIVGCSQVTGESRSEYAPLVSQVPGPSSDAARYRVLHSFGGLYDGIRPQSALIDVKGILYGTTLQGGPSSCQYGCGTVFSITASGREHVLYGFGPEPDGFYPASLVDVGGVIYGTTLNGGAYGYGTVFSITTSGKEKVLYSFRGPDGRYPKSRLIGVNGLLYGTTISGGTHNLGTVFSLSASGVERVLHSFGKSPDGFYPKAGLIWAGAMLYGTTYFGGQRGGGTVFSISTSGRERVLHSFRIGDRDGYNPMAPLIDVNGMLYGTSLDGGTHGFGTIFSVSPSGTETVQYSFSGKPDGESPEAGLIAAHGTLYGTTSLGGAYGLGGTVFGFRSGVETVLHSFASNFTTVQTDGSNPVASLIELNDTLYGTTVAGGSHGDGIVFSLPTDTPLTMSQPPRVHRIVSTGADTY